MDVTVLIPSYKRRANLPVIMKALGGQTRQAKEIIIINNAGDVTLEIEGATVINCDRNFGPIARPAIGLLAETSHVLCHDDDLMLGPKAIENFMYWAEKLPGAILGYEGRQIAVEHDKPYSAGQMERATRLLEPREIDIVYGKALFCETQTLRYHWELFFQAENGLRDEDIYMTLGHKNYLIPLMKGAELTVLSDYGVALSSRENFWEERDRVTNDVLMVLGRKDGLTKG